MKISRIIFILILTTFIFNGGFYFNQKVFSAGYAVNCGMSGGPSAFGGRYTTICKCRGPGFIVKVSSPRGGNFYFGPGSKAYSHGSPALSAWTVGGAGSVVVCLDRRSKHPRPMSGSRIRIEGRS